MDNRTDRQTSSWKQVLSATEDNGAFGSYERVSENKLQLSASVEFLKQLPTTASNTANNTFWRQFLFTHARQYVINSLHLLNFVNGMLFNDYY